MANQEIVGYIKRNLENKVGMDSIKSALLQSGWPLNEIEEAIQEVNMTGAAQLPEQKVPAPQAGEKKGVSKKLIIAVIVLIILFVVFLYVAVKIVTDFRTMFPGGGDIIPMNVPFVS